MKQLSNTPIEQLIRNVKIGLNNKANINHIHGSYTDEYKKYTRDDYLKYYQYEGWDSVDFQQWSTREYYYMMDFDNGIRLLNMHIIIHEWSEPLKYFTILGSATNIAEVTFPFSFIDDDISVYYSFSSLLNHVNASLTFFPIGYSNKCKIYFRASEVSNTHDKNGYNQILSSYSWRTLLRGENVFSMNILAIGKWK